MVTLVQKIADQRMHSDVEMSIYQSTEEYTKLPIKHTFYCKKKRIII